MPKERVRYLPQKFVKQLCAPQNTENLEREIERVIFQRIPKTNRLGASDFKELRQLTSKAIAVNKSGLQSDIEALNRSIYEGFRKTSQRVPKQAQLEKKESQLKELLKKAPSLPAQNNADLQELDKLGNMRSDLEARVVGLNESLSTIEELRALFSTFEKQVAAFNSRVLALLKSVGLESEASTLAVQTPSSATVAATLDARKDAIDVQVRALSVGDAHDSIEGVNKSITSLQEKLNLSVSRKEEYDKFQADRKGLEETISSLRREMADIDQNLVPKLKEERSSRVERYLDCLMF